MAAVLILDDDAEHRRVIGHLIKRIYPDIGIAEHDKAVSADINAVPNLQLYAAIIMNNVVAGQSTLPWMKTVVDNANKVPAFIVLSSIVAPGPEDIQQIVRTIKQGAINFYLKKNMDMHQLMEDVSTVLGPAAKKDATEIKRPDEDAPHEGETLLEMRERKAREAEAEAALALEMLQGHKQWPFTMDEILSGNASMGRYHIDSFLGEDSTASTFRAFLQGIKAPIALKIINRVRVGEKAIPESFANNFKTISQRKHPNIIRLLNFEVIDDRMIVALEFLRGKTLEDKLKEGKLSDAYALHYFRQLLEGMSVLHELGIELHQIVPRQLMLRDEKTLVLTQIGLLNSLHALSDIVGEWPLPFSTPVYTTPENVQKHPTDQRSDVYLAGLIGYELFAGEPLFSEGSDQDIMFAHAAEPVKSLANAAHPMNKLLQEMLHKLPDNRPQNAAEALARLKQLVK